MSLIVVREKKRLLVPPVFWTCPYCGTRYSSPDTRRIEMVKKLHSCKHMEMIRNEKAKN